MDNPPRRSRRQLYLGFLFVGLAIVAALVRTFTAPTPTGDSEYERVEAIIGLTAEEAADQLGPPTATLSFAPGEETNPLREMVFKRLSADGDAIPDELIEMSWFDGTLVTTIWFAASPDALSGDDAVSVDAVRYERSPSGTALD